MKPFLARTAASLALLLASSAACLRAQSPAGPPHSGPPASGPGMPGSPSSAGPATPRPRDIGPSHTAPRLPRSTSQFGPAGRWWDDKSVTRAIGITREQQRRMDSIFDANKPAILASYKVFLKQQSHLESVNKDPRADQAATFAAIDAVNSARAALQKATAQMLLQIRHEMSADQIEKLEKLP